MPENNSNMQRIHRKSISDKFEVEENDPIPELPEGGARVQVHFAGATYTDAQVPAHVRTPGVHDTSLFPGYEVSGVIDRICNKVSCDLKVGDRVIVYPEDEEITESGYADYIIVKNVRNIMRVPDNLSLEVAALLPCGALLAYTAMKRVKPFIEQKILAAAAENSDALQNILIVGAGGLGLWTLRMAQNLIGNLWENKVHITVADVSIDKLMVAKDQGCFDVIHWNDSIHEEYILERTKDVCRGGVDVAIDFVSSPRTISRVRKVLNEDGVIVVGGHSKYDISMSLQELARHNQSILGVKRGKKKQLEELITLVSTHQIDPPQFQIFPVAEANKVFEQLQECRLSGRAVLQLAGEPTNQETLPT